MPSTPTILVIDEILPRFNKDSGSQRMMHLLSIFKELGYQIIFVPNDGCLVEPYYGMLTNMGIEILGNKHGTAVRKEDILKVLPRVNIAWMSRPKVNRKFQYIFRYNKDIRWIYDTVDLHFMRHAREAGICRNPFRKFQLERRARRYKKVEIALARSADLTIAITSVEAEILKQNGAREVRIVPNIHMRRSQLPPAFEERQGILFIGSYDHSPNRDAAVWLIKKIMPLVWAQLPELQVKIVGNNPNPEVEALAESRVHVTGFVPDAENYFNTSRVFVAPLRFGAGMKGKIGQALEHALPIVSTSIGAEGMGLESGREILIADDEHTFAQAILRLYTDQVLWTEIQDHSFQSLAPFSYDTQKNNVQSILNFTNTAFNMTQTITQKPD